MEFSNAIKNYRIGRSLTQGELAASVGVAQPTVSAWESGKSRPRLSHLATLASALEVEPSSLVDLLVAP